MSDGSCRMGWPLNNSAVFVLDELYWLNDDLPSLSILLYCDIPHIAGEIALDDDLAISVQVKKFYLLVRILYAALIHTLSFSSLSEVG